MACLLTGATHSKAVVLCVHLSVVQEAECAYVIILMAVYWCTEVLPLSVTALLPALLFPLFGIMESKDVSKITLTMHSAQRGVSPHTSYFV